MSLPSRNPVGGPALLSEGQEECGHPGSVTTLRAEAGKASGVPGVWGRLGSHSWGE